MVRRVVPDLSPEDVPAARDFMSGFLDSTSRWTWASLLLSCRRQTRQLRSLSNQDATANLTMEVEDVHAVHRAAQERGDDIVYLLTDEDWGVRRFFVRDPSGGIVNIMRHTAQ